MNPGAELIAYVAPSCHYLSGKDDVVFLGSPSLPRSFVKLSKHARSKQASILFHHWNVSQEVEREDENFAIGRPVTPK